jgi:signal transduction histidine kinase
MHSAWYMDLTAVLDGLLDGVMVFDAQGKLTAINKTGLRILSAQCLEELLERKPPVARDEEGTPIPPDCSPVARALRGEQVVHQLELLDGQKGPRVVLRARATPIRDQAGAIIGVVKTLTDVTYEHALERLKEDFIRVAAHELKTPVTLIRANAEATSNSLPDLPTSARQLLDALVRGADRIDRLVSSLLDLLELQGGLLSLSCRRVRLDQILAEVVSQLPRAAAARIRIPESPPVEVFGDARRLRQVTRALLDNAIKFSALRTPIEVTLARDERSVHLKVRDHGFGIPARAREHIFEKFFRAHSGTPQDTCGIGVGLFVAREIVRQHGGSIGFESVEREGTVFDVELPLGKRA